MRILIIELKLSIPGRSSRDQIHETWDVEYFQIALEEIYAVSEFDKFTKAEGSGVQ